ncbi:MAG: hypothetical protein R3321_01165 [Nitrososphaeraceae archaeon]|nr:hypothetical protein [Nitrososphaeraceae archaeon]
MDNQQPSISYVYIIFGEDHRAYIGSKLGDPSLDNYMGSPTDDTFKPKTKFVLKITENRNIAGLIEHNLLTAFDVHINDRFANKKRLASTGMIGNIRPEKDKIKIAKTLKGRPSPTKGMKMGFNSHASKALKGRKEPLATTIKKIAGRKGDGRAIDLFLERYEGSTTRAEARKIVDYLKREVFFKKKYGRHWWLHLTEEERYGLTLDESLRDLVESIKS